MFLYAKYSLGLIAYPREYAIYACAGAKLLKVHETSKENQIIDTIFAVQTFASNLNFLTGSPA